MIKPITYGLLLAFLLSPSAVIAKDIDFIVLGVIASSDDQQGIALIKQKTTDRVTAVQEGQQISPELKLERVDRRYVVVEYKNEPYRLAVGDDTLQSDRPRVRPISNAHVSDLRNTAGIERDGDVLTISDSLKESLVSENLNQILMQAAAIPHTQDGRLVGFQLLEIDEGSIFDVAGFKDGDIITHINDQPINNAGIAIRALNELRQADQASFSYKRADQILELTIRIN